MPDVNHDTYDHASVTGVADPAWTAFTPTWTASGSAPSVGNGSLSGAFRTRGKSHAFRIHLVAGSTTNFGSGRWDFTIGTATAPAGSSIKQIVAALMMDLSAVTMYAGAGWIGSGGSNPVVRVTANATAGNGIDSGKPFTWATGDELHVEGTIELA